MTIKQALHRFIRDKHGHVVIAQKPNLPIIAWFVLMIISHLLGEGIAQSGTAALSAASLFTWAYLEATAGASLFRRVLGAVVLMVVIVGFFR